MNVLLISNLERVALVGENERIPFASGIFKRGGDYYLTFCHGGEDGSLSLRGDGTDINVTPSNMRLVLSAHFGIDVPDRAKIFIIPCYPDAVIRRYRGDLEDNNIKILGDWSGLTYAQYFDGKEVICWGDKKDVKKISMLIRDEVAHDTNKDYWFATDVFTGKIDARRI